MRRISKRTWLPIVLGTIAALLLLVFDILKGDLAKIFPSLPLWIILGGIVVLVVLATALTLWYERLKSPPAVPHAEAFSPENRQIMLGFVKDKWIDGFLKNERYYDKKLLPLGLYRCIGDPLAPVLENPLDPAIPVPPGTSITEVFDQAEGELLILGEPGSGKSTLLLELTCDLLERAKNDEKNPIPIVLLLSSWAVERLPLDQWIAEELQTKYQVPSEFGLAWAQHHRLLLLLDGLDEVTPEVLPACIKELNTYAGQAQKAMVVCCRTKEYLAQSARLGLHTAVSVQPLSSQHIDTYLSTQGEYVVGLKSALQQSRALAALAVTPLFLRVLMLAYHGKPAEDVLQLAATWSG